MSVIFSVKAQNTPIDDLLKQYTSRENVVHVSISRESLKTIFPSLSISIPQAYSSLSISRTDLPASVFIDFKTMLLSSNYRPHTATMNETGDITLIYFVKRNPDSTSEIMVLRQEKDLFLAVHIMGNFDDVAQGQLYLRQLRNYLNQTNQNSEVELLDVRFVVSIGFNNENYTHDIQSIERAFESSRQRRQNSNR